MKITDFNEIGGKYQIFQEITYRSPYFIEKIQILSDFFVPTNPQNLMKSWKLSDFLEKYIILKHFTRAFQ